MPMRAGVLRRARQRLNWRDLRSLAPAWLLVETYAKRRFAHDLVGQHWIRGVESATPYVAVQALQFAGLEHSAAAGRGQRQINHLLGTFRDPMLERDDLHRPGHAVVHARRPVL